MAKTGTSGSVRLGQSVLKLLEHEKVELRSAAATVLSAVGKGDDAVVAITVDGRENGWLIVSIRTVIAGWTAVVGVRQPI